MRLLIPLAENFYATLRAIAGMFTGRFNNSLFFNKKVLRPNYRRCVMLKNIYQLVMNSRFNPLSNINDKSVAHLVMQLLAWMWCIVFSMWMGSILVFGVSAIIHAILIAGIFITAITFETARRKPEFFGK
tara:strand:- start:2197 stop:2586 length:390 start_codon:yes stop_codon:yes gene_type:complete